MVQFNQFQTQFKLTDNEASTIQMVLEGYSQPVEVKGIIYRICNLIKSLFGCSDWQRAEKILVPRSRNVLKERIELPENELLEKATNLSRFLLNYFRVFKCITKDALWVLEEPGILPLNVWNDVRNLSLDEIITRASFGNGLTFPHLNEEYRELFLKKDEKAVLRGCIEYLEKLLAGIRDESDTLKQTLEVLIQAAKGVYLKNEISLEVIRKCNQSLLAFIGVGDGSA